MSQLGEKERTLLQSTRILDDCKDAKVVWARVKGYPYWPVRRAGAPRLPVWVA